MEGEGEFGVRWQESTRDFRTVNKQKFFATAEAREAYTDKLQAKDRFVEFLGWSDPREEN